MDVPHHVGIIMDGNRRFAKKALKEPWHGHAHGKDTFRNCLYWCEEIGIKVLTVYALSAQNLSRPKKELDVLFKLMEEMLQEFIDDPSELVEKDVRIRVVGRLDLLPEKLQTLIYDLMDSTANHSSFTCNVCVAYGGREEIVDAVKHIAQEAKEGLIDPESITKDTITNHVYITGEPDMIIRTSGEHRTSNFLVWQSWYSEWFFCDKMWPEFTKEDLAMYVQEYQDRKRRFGK